MVQVSYDLIDSRLGEEEDTKDKGGCVNEELGSNKKRQHKYWGKKSCQLQSRCCWERWCWR